MSATAGVLPTAMPRTALDILPSDELGEVLRHFSMKPGHPEWERWIESKDLAVLSRCGGALTAAAKRHISTLRLALACEGDAERLRDIWETLGPNCTNLEMVAFRVAGSPMWHAAYAQHCTSLRSLSLRLGADAPSIDSFLAPVSGTLKKLRVACNPAAVGALYSSLTRHRPALESLELDVGFRNAPGLTKMMWTIGGSLEHLILNVRDAMLPPDVRDTEGLTLPVLSRQCPKLHDLELHGDLKGARGSAEMLVLLLGPRLKRLVLPFLGLRPAFLGRVVECCPNAKFETTVIVPGTRPDDFLHGERANPGPTMRVLGKQLEVFDFRDGFRREASFSQDAMNASALCSLTINEICNGGKELIMDVFSQRRSTLTDLKLTFKVAPVALVTDSLRIVACNTGALESLSITCPSVGSEALEVFTNTNYSLRSVNIARNTEPQSKLDAVCSVIDSFLSAKCLRFLSISDKIGIRWRRVSQHKEMRVRYRALRDRRVLLTIDDMVCVK